MDEKMSETAERFGTTVDRTSPQKLTVRRTFNAPARLVFEAWTRSDLMMRWWVPKSLGITLLSCETDVRPGGTYRLEFGVPGSDQPVAFFGRYLEVEQNRRLVWTNEEGEEGAVTTVTFEEQDGKTLLVLRDVYPSAEALDAAIAEGSTGAWSEQFDALDTLLVTL
jgi:uncharacterized protein YndB with AHSA1/START domain